MIRPFYKYQIIKTPSLPQKFVLITISYRFWSSFLVEQISIVWFSNHLVIIFHQQWQVVQKLSLDCWKFFNVKSPINIIWQSDILALTTESFFIYNCWWFIYRTGSLDIFSIPEFLLVNTRLIFYHQQDQHFQKLAPLKDPPNRVALWILACQIWCSNLAQGFFTIKYDGCLSLNVCIQYLWIYYGVFYRNRNFMAL